MSYAFSSFVACPNIQEGIEAGYFKADPTMFPGHINTLRALTAPFNESGILQRQIDTQNGHYRQVEIRYQPRGVDSDTSSVATLNCDTGPVFGETSQVYNIDPAVGASRRWSVSLSDLADRCESDELYVARQVAMHMQAIKRTMSAEAIDFISANFGHLGYTDSVLFTTKTKLSSGAFADDMLSDTVYQYQLAEGWDRPIVIGGELSHKYMTAVNSHCCATVNVDLERMRATDAQMYFFFDPLADITFGAGEFAMLAPGAVQLIRYNEFKGAKGIRTIDDDSIKQGVIQDPETGLEFDYYAQIDCGVWKFQLKLAYKYVGMPTDIFLSSDNLEGVNYIFNGKVDNA